MADGYDVWNQQAGDWMRGVAADQATRAYNQSMANNEGERIALDRAKFAWQQQMDRAGLTGKFENEWTLPSMTGFANQFGTWAAPTAGQETMAREQQTYGQQMGYGQMYGQYYAPGTAPTPGQQTLAAQQQALQNAQGVAGLTGWYQAPGTTGQGVQTLQGQQQQFQQGLQTQQEARAAQGQQQSQAQAYLQLLSSLRGPADWAKYQQVLGSTPGGMRDLAAAAMGQYVPGGGATSGYQPQAVSLQSMMGDVSGNPYYGQGGGQLTMPNVYQGGQGSYGQQAQPNPYAAVQQQQPPQGEGQMSAMVYRPGYQAPSYQQVMQQRQQPAAQPGEFSAWSPQGAAQQKQTWGSGIGVGQQQPTPQQQQQGLGNGTNLPAPNQIAAQSWKNMAPSQQQMLLGQYEAQGWDKGDVQALMNQSLPRYASNAPTAGTFRLQ